MLERIVSWLGWSNRPKRLMAAKVVRMDALLAYRRAKARGDTREQHRWAREARQATAEVVRLELGR